MSTALASLQEEIKAQLLASKEAVKASAPKITAKDGIFKLPDGTTSQGPLEIIILDYRWLYKYYSKPYNPNEIDLPDCYAINFKPKDLKPAKTVKNPINKDCETCPKNQWGSSTSGSRKGKACRNTLRTAIVPADFSANSPIWTIDFAPTSTKNFSNYVSALRDMHNRIPLQEITELSMTQGATATLLTLKGLGPHKNLETAFALQQQCATILDHPFE